MGDRLTIQLAPLLSLLTVPTGVVTALGLPTALGLTTAAGFGAGVGIMTGIGLVVGAGVGITTGAGAFNGAGVGITTGAADAVAIKASSANIDVVVLIITLLASCLFLVNT